MAFYKKSKFNAGTKTSPNYKWIPRAKLVGKQITVKDLAKRIAAESTVSETDVRAVLTSLPSIMGMYMGLGRSVKLDGIGSFQYTINCTGTAVDSPDKVSTKQITDVRVRFQPERTYGAGRTGMTRAMAEDANEIEWIDIDSLTATDDEEASPNPSQGGGNGGGTNTGDNTGGGTGTIDTGGGGAFPSPSQGGENGGTTGGDDSNDGGD